MLFCARALPSIRKHIEQTQTPIKHNQYPHRFVATSCVGIVGLVKHNCGLQPTNAIGDLIEACVPLVRKIRTLVTPLPPDWFVIEAIVLQPYGQPVVPIDLTPPNQLCLHPQPRGHYNFDNCQGYQSLDYSILRNQTLLRSTVYQSRK